MAKFRENELNENLKEYQDKTIIIEFENNIEGHLVLKHAHVMYDSKSGFIEIKSDTCSFKINTTLVNQYEKNENTVCIILENLSLKIIDL